ncbi:MAG TPA: hypothetical protein VMZ69_02695 [Saprospiraceae bacterium]|nr:hypothetical protein [Saprospiraceae bacterium]
MMERAGQSSTPAGNSDIPSNTITKVFTHHSDVWIITHNGITGYNFSKFNGASWQTWEHILTASSINFDDDNNVWITSIHDGLIKFYDDQFTSFNSSNSCLYQDATTSSFVDSQNDIKWVGMYGSSLSGDVAGLVRMEGDSCTAYTQMNSGFPTHNYVFKIFPDPTDANVIWINTNYGLAKFDGTNWIIYQHPSSSGSEAVAIDSTGGIWIGSIFSGIGRHKGNWESFYGLPDGGINDVEVDFQNKVWVATESKGLAVFDNSITAIFDPGIKDNFIISTLVSDQIKVQWDYPFANSCLLYLHSSFSSFGNAIFSLQSGETTLNIDPNLSDGLYFYTVANAENEILQSGKIVIIR